MLNSNNKKPFLLFLSLCMLNQTYAMEIKEKQNSKEEVSLLLCLQNEDIEGAKKLLNEKASLTNLTSYSEDNDFESSEDSEDKNNACHDNIFHKLMSPKVIRVVITHGRFDTYNEEADKNLEKTIRLCLRVFNRLNSLASFPRIPKEVQFHIFSYLIESNSLDGFAGKLLNQAVKSGCNSPLLHHTNERILGIKKLLESKGNRKQTPLETFKSTLNNLFIRKHINENSKNEILSLLNVENLQKEADEFDKAYKASDLKSLSEDNLKYQIYLNSNKLLLGLSISKQ